LHSIVATRKHAEDRQQQGWPPREILERDAKQEEGINDAFNLFVFGETMKEEED